MLIDSAYHVAGILVRSVSSERDKVGDKLRQWFIDRQAAARAGQQVFGLGVVVEDGRKVVGNGPISVQFAQVAIATRQRDVAARLWYAAQHTQVANPCRVAIDI